MEILFDIDFLLEFLREEFIEDIFHKQLGIKYMIVGDDLRFGHERRGDFQLLKRMGAEFGFQVSDTKTLENDGERVSSSRIRIALENANFEFGAFKVGTHDDLVTALGLACLGEYLPTIPKVHPVIL